MRISSTLTTLTLVCLTWFCCGCLQPVYETASNEDGVAEPMTSSGGPAIPSSMVPGIPGAGELSAGEQPPVPNYPPVQPPSTARPTFDPNLPAAGAGVRVRAESGVGKQGQSLKDERGIGAMMVQPARTLFAFKQRAVFEIQIPSAFKLFVATEDRKPKSHDEYMTKIIKANRIQLPELPAGQTYIYDPQLGELMVQKPGG